MGFEGLGDLMRSRCLSQETPKPRRFSAEASLRRGAFPATLPKRNTKAADANTKASTYPATSPRLRALKG